MAYVCQSFPIVMTRILETTELEALPKLFGRLVGTHT